MTYPLRVLIAGNLADDLGRIMAELHRNGFEPAWEQVDDPAALDAALMRQEWDVALTDHGAAGFDARAFLAQLQAQQPDTPLILITSAACDEQTAAALRAGVQGLVARDRLTLLAPVIERELRDVAERRARRQAQQAQRESEAMYRALFENAGDALFVADAETGAILDANQRACELVGRPRAELIGRPQTDLHPPEQRAAYAALFAEHGRSTVHWPLEALVRHAAGHDIPVEISTSLIQVGGRPAILGIFRDIRQRQQAIAQELAERRRAEEDARQRSRQLSILNELGLALAETLDLAQVYRTAYEQVSRLADTDGFAITLYAPAAHELRPTYVVSDGQPVDVSVFPPIVISDKAPSGRGRAIITKEPEVVHYQRPSQGSVVVGQEPRSAAYVPMVVKGTVTGLLEVQSCRPDAYGAAEVALLGPAANQIGLAIENARLYEAVQHELNERKRAEASLRQTLLELTRSNADLEQYAYVAAHDLQEPLRMVASFVQLLAARYRGQLDADADDFIGYAVEGATRMQTLINNLLEYSLVDRSDQPFRPTDCEAALEEALRNLEFPIADSGAHITYDPLPTVLGDATQLQQVFENLIHNAIKFRSAAPPRIHITATLRDVTDKTANSSSAGRTTNGERPTSEWLFSVRDNGIGIEPQYAERIFRLFQRLHSRHEYSGTGIGLAICKKIIERHGGRIWVESELGAGATFYFTIPAEAK